MLDHMGCDRLNLLAIKSATAVNWTASQIVAPPMHLISTPLRYDVQLVLPCQLEGLLLEFQHLLSAAGINVNSFATHGEQGQRDNGSEINPYPQCTSDKGTVVVCNGVFILFLCSEGFTALDDVCDELRELTLRNFQFGSAFVTFARKRY